MNYLLNGEVSTMNDADLPLELPTELPPETPEDLSLESEPDNSDFSTNKRVHKGIVGIDYEDLKMCNCASCRRELLSRRYIDWYKRLTTIEQYQYPQLVGGRYRDRPYCARCLNWITSSKFLN